MFSGDLRGPTLVRSGVGGGGVLPQLLKKLPDESIQKGVKPLYVRHSDMNSSYLNSMHSDRPKHANMEVLN
jgi:hypothetical protein